jgi:hypothetical protein
MFACFKKPCVVKTVKEKEYEGLNKHQRSMYNHSFTNKEKHMFHNVLNKGRFFSSKDAYNYVMLWRPKNNKKNGVFGALKNTYMINR